MAHSEALMKEYAKHSRCFKVRSVLLVLCLLWVVIGHSVVEFFFLTVVMAAWLHAAVSMESISHQMHHAH